MKRKNKETTEIKIKLNNMETRRKKNNKKI